MRDYRAANKTGLMMDMNAEYAQFANAATVCVRKTIPAKTAYNNYNKCRSSWADLLVADRQAKLNYASNNTNWSTFSDEMDTYIKSYFAQYTYCNNKARRYNVYVTLTKRNFRMCSDAHTNFSKDMKDLTKDFKASFRG